MDNSREIVDNIVNSNLVDAKQLIKESLLRRVGTYLEEQIEFIAPSMISEEEKAKETKKEKEKENLLKGNTAKFKGKSKTDEAYDSEEAIFPNQNNPENSIEVLNDFDIDFEDFVNEIHEIVQEIESETGEELTEEEIQEIGREYFNVLTEELDSDDVIEEELKGNQHKIDANKNGEIDKGDFPILRKRNLKNKGK